MTRSLSTDPFLGLLEGLSHRTALLELGVLAGCLVAAWGVVRVMRGFGPASGSIWLGERTVDGVLFPVLALLLAAGAGWMLPAWVPVAVFRVAVPVLMSLAVIRLTVRVLGRAFPEWAPMRVVERSVSWIAWLAVVLWVTGVLPLLLAELDQIHWKVGSASLSVRSLLEGFLTAGFVLMLALWVSAAIEARLLKGAIGNLSLRKMAASALRALLLFVGLIFALSAAGIDLTALGVLGGALGVGIGLGLQKLAANYVSGFVLLAERAVRIGDMVRVDTFEGRITDITTRYTVIRALNGREAIVPNEIMITQRVENSTLADTRVALNTTVQVAYGTDLSLLMPALAKAVAVVPGVIETPAPGVQLTAFAADGLELTIGFWLDDPANGRVKSDVNLAVLAALDAAGVEIPYPQRVLRRAARA